LHAQDRPVRAGRKDHRSANSHPHADPHHRSANPNPHSDPHHRSANPNPDTDNDADPEPNTAMHPNTFKPTPPSFGKPYPHNNQPAPNQGALHRIGSGNDLPRPYPYPIPKAIQHQL
jgi:hypothetical protein